MSLALVVVPTTDFFSVYQHLVSLKPWYRNMHLRSRRKVNGVYDLRYLHMMYAPPGANLRIDGMISGPGLFWHYYIEHVGGVTQLNVLSQVASARERRRIARRFLPEVLNRVAQESGPPPGGYSPGSAGQYYLRRGMPGSASNRPNCVSAIATGVLDTAFVAQLRRWNFRLVRP